MFINFKNFIYELSEFKRFKKLEKKKKEVIFYSEHQNQWDFFENTIKYLLKKNIPVCYASSSKLDPNLKKKKKNLSCFYIGSKSIRTIFFSTLNTKVLIMSLPDLNKYEIKRSRYNVKYIFIPHNILSTHMVFREGAFDKFDSFFCAGSHHFKEIRETEKLYKLKKKELIKFGYSRLDKIIENIETIKKHKKNKKIINVLIAPSWGKNCLFETGADDLIEYLSNQNFRITLRPHPDTIKKNPLSIENLLSKFKDNKRIIYNPKISSIQSYFENDILISDWSGSAFEFAFGTLKPVIFIDLPKKINNKNYYLLKNTPVEINMRNSVGKVIKKNNFHEIAKTIKTMIKDKNKWKKRLLHLRYQKIYNLKKSGKIGGDFILKCLKTN